MSTFRKKLTDDVKNIQDRQCVATGDQTKVFDEKLENYIMKNWKLHGHNEVRVVATGEFYEYLKSNWSFLSRWLTLNESEGLLFRNPGGSCPCDEEPKIVLMIPLTNSSKYL